MSFMVKADTKPLVAPVIELGTSGPIATNSDHYTTEMIPFIYSQVNFGVYMYYRIN
jgi:hypothetical protein